MSEPVTWLYRVRPGKGGWARAWVTDDGCLSIMSDWGNYAYWWGGDNGDHRGFLSSCGVDYIASKLAGGKTEVDHDATVKGIREKICLLRREERLTQEQARGEWDLLNGVDFENERDSWRWYESTELQDASEALRHQRPIQLQMFMRNCWPLLVAEMRRDMGAAVRERSVAWFRRAA